jgi:hypothetical protein
MRKSKRNITKRHKIKSNTKTVSKITRKSKKCVYTDEAKRILEMIKYIKNNRTNKNKTNNNKTNKKR